MSRRRRQEIQEARWADEEIARRARCQKTVAMYERFREALERWPRHHRIENVLLGLGYSIDKGRELLPAEEAFLEGVLRGVEEAMASGCPA